MLDRIYIFDGYAGWDPEVSARRIIRMLANEKLYLGDIFRRAEL